MESSQQSPGEMTTEHDCFRWREADAYLFDIDGTLLLSPDRTHRYALHRAMLDVYGVETSIDGIPYHGKTDPGILRAYRIECSRSGPAALLPALRTQNL